MDTKVNLCSFCKFEHPTCDSQNVEFGDGEGNDNVISCDTYKHNPNLKSTEKDKGIELELFFLSKKMLQLRKESTVYRLEDSFKEISERFRGKFFNRVLSDKTISAVCYIEDVSENDLYISHTNEVRFFCTGSTLFYNKTTNSYTLREKERFNGKFLGKEISKGAWDKVCNSFRSQIFNFAIKSK